MSLSYRAACFALVVELWPTGIAIVNDRGLGIASASMCRLRTQPARELIDGSRKDDRRAVLRTLWLSISSVDRRWARRSGKDALAVHFETVPDVVDGTCARFRIEFSSGVGSAGWSGGRGVFTVLTELASEGSDLF